MGISYKLIFIVFIEYNFFVYVSNFENQNYLQFTFDTKIISISKSKLNYIYNETNFINDFLNNNISISVNMGIPSQNVKIFLDPKEICFSFTKNNEIIKLNEYYVENNNYNKILPYNKTKSTTAKISKLTNNYNNNKNKEYNNLYEIEEVFNLGKSKKENISFLYLKFLYENQINDKDESVYGKIGLNMNNYKDATCPRFINSLKNNNILKKYNWFLDFFSTSHGLFYIGPEPHFYNKTNSTYKDYQYVKIHTFVSINGHLEWKLLFNKIIIKNATNNYIFNLNNRLAEIDINLGLIIGTNEFQEIIEKNYFNFLIKKNTCKKTLVEFRNTNKESNKYYVYRCNSSLSHYFSVSYYDIFPEIEFFHIDSENSHKLLKYDIFERINGFYYFLIIFEAEKPNNIWKLGQPFLRRHQLIFDHDSKIIGYYDRKIKLNIEKSNLKNKINDISKNEKKYDSNKNKAENKNSIKYMIQILVFCIIIIFTFYLGMKIKESRRKRANELKDDDFEYLQHDIKNKKPEKLSQNIELYKIGK